MKARQFWILGTLLMTACLMWACGRALAEPTRGRVVRIAELEVHPVHLDSYKAALREEIETSVRVEPGVLTLYAVSLRNDPAQIRILEVYADMDAYRAHLQTPHFQKYKTGTQHMVKSLRLVETDPILLGAKSASDGRSGQ